MLAADTSTMALPVLSSYGQDPTGSGPQRHVPEPSKQLRPGTAVYHCYRYERYADPVPTYADGRVPDALPAEPRVWRLTPWRNYERNAEFDALAATEWMATQLRFTDSDPNLINDHLKRRIDAIVAECAHALDTLTGAYQTIINLHDGNMIALAVVGIWDPTEIHPRLGSRY